MPIYPNDLDIPPFQFRRAQQSTVTNYVAAQGEPVWSTDGQTLYIGDGSTVGGIPVGGVGFTATNAVVNKLVNGSYEVALNANGTMSFPFGGTLDVGNVDDFYIKNTDYPINIESRNTGTKVGSHTAGIDSATIYARDTGDGSNVEIVANNNDTANPVATIKVQAAGGTERDWTFNDDGTTSFPSYTFPYADGTSGQVLATNGSGTLAWTTSSGGGSNPFDQDLNTTNNVTFAGLTLTTQLVNLGLEATGSSYSHQAIGFQANASGAYAVALGHQSKGYGLVSIAIGAGSKADGDASIAIGNQAGSSPSFTVTNASNSIIINATGNQLNSSQSGLYVAPIRNTTSTQILYYDTTTKEITYGANSGGGGSSYDQSLNTTDNVIHKSLKTTGIVSSGGYPLDANGQALIVNSNTQTAAMVVSNYTSGTLPGIQIRGWGSNRPTGNLTGGSGQSAIILESARGSTSTPTALISADTIGAIAMGGYDGTRWSTENANQTTFQLVAQATETWASSGTTVTNAGTRFFIRTQPQGVQVDATSRQIHMFQTWTAGSTSAPPVSNLLFGSGVDSSTPTLINSNGLNSHTGYGQTNVNWVNTKHFVIGTPGEETFTLTGSISGTTLTVTALTSSASVMSVGSRIYSGANSYGFITAQLTGTTGGTGTYTLSTSSSVSSGTLSHGGDNTTLAGTNYLMFAGGRKSGVSGRRNKLQAGDTLGQLLFFGQTADSATSTGVQGAAIVTKALDTFSGSAQGSKINFYTANSGTTYASGNTSRLELKNTANLHTSDIHNFRNAFNNTQLAYFSTATANINSDSFAIYNSNGSTRNALFTTGTIALENSRIQVGVSGTPPRLINPYNEGIGIWSGDDSASILSLNSDGTTVFQNRGIQVLNISSSTVTLNSNAYYFSNSVGSAYLGLDSNGATFGSGSANAVIASNGSYDLVMTTNGSSESGIITAKAGVGQGVVIQAGNKSSPTSVASFTTSSIVFSDITRTRLELNGTNHKVFSDNHVLHNGVGDKQFASFDITQVVLRANDTSVATFTTASIEISAPITVTGLSSLTGQQTSGMNAGSTAYTIFSFDPSAYSGAKLVCKIKDSADLHMVEMMVISDGTNTTYNEYAVVTNNGDLGTFSATVSGGQVLVRFTTKSGITNANAKVSATLLA